jgi:hypothetical protein
MSYYSAPFRREDDSSRKKRKEQTSLVAQARQAAEQIPAPPEDKVVVSRPQRQEQRTSATVPPVLEVLLYHEDQRAAARAAKDTQLANRALVDVAGDLNVLLDSAESYLRQTAQGSSRKRIRNAMPHLVAMRTISALPLVEVAEFLDLPADRVGAALASLARYGGIHPAERQQALEQIQWLRGQLQQAVVTKDHSLLDRLLAFVSKFVLLGIVALASAAAGAIAVGESVLKEVIKTAVIALVAAALQMGTDHMLAQRTKQSQSSAARKAHDALLLELSTASALWEEPAYEGEHAIIRIKLAVRMCVVRVASIPLEWRDKWHYWDLLDQITAALGEDTPHSLWAQQRRITALSPPA